MRKSALLFLGLLLTTSGVTQAFAVPSANLRVIVYDLDGQSSGFGATFSVTAATGDPVHIDNTGTIVSAERVTVYGGDVFAANVDKISKINLDSQGQPIPSSPNNNVEDITGSVFTYASGIATTSDGTIYAVDNYQQIYSVNPAGAPTATPSLVPIDGSFGNINHIVINNEVLYILDTSAEGGSGAIFKIDLSQAPSPEYVPELIYSGADHDEPLSGAVSIAVKGTDIFVSGYDFSFGSGIIKIDTVSHYITTIIGLYTL
jgi:hypothetical protein